MSSTHRRHTNRGLRSWVCAIVCGASLTYAIAWASALWSPYTRRVRPTVLEKYIGIGQEHHHAFGFHVRTTRGSRGFSEMGYWHFKEWSGHYDSTFTAGWPTQAVTSDVRAYHAEPLGPALQGLDLPVGILLTRGYPTDRLPAFLHAQPRRRLPLIPAWPGFLVSTVFYAILTLALWLTASNARRWLRTRRDCCPSCGYSLAGLRSNSCPECGSDTYSVNASVGRD